MFDDIGVMLVCLATVVLIVALCAAPFVWVGYYNSPRWCNRNREPYEKWYADEVFWASMFCIAVPLMPFALALFHVSFGWLIFARYATGFIFVAFMLGKWFGHYWLLPKLALRRHKPRVAAVHTQTT